MKLPKDNIGRQSYVDKINYLVETLPKDGNFCLALDGGWGSGKSYVMGMLENTFQQHKEYCVVYYDAWKNNFYPDPLIAILYCVLDALPKETIAGKYLRLIKNEVKKLAKEKVTERTEQHVDELVDKLYRLGGFCSVCAFSVEVIKSVIKQAKSSILDNKIFGDFKSYQSLLNESIAALNALTKLQKDGTQRKIIILVDEIDRCLPSEQLTVLERVHHLFNVKNCVVVVALNKTAICNNFKSQFQNDGKEYLRKFFNYNFSLYSQWTNLLRNLIKDLVGELNSSKTQANVYTEAQTELIITAIINEFSNVEQRCGHKFSNRDISEYFSKFRKIWEENGTADIVHLGFVLLMLLYKQYDPTEFLLYKFGKDDSGKDDSVNFTRLTFPENIREYDWHHDSGLIFYIYDNQICSTFSLFINLVKFRNDNKVAWWLQSINSANYYHFYTWSDKSKEFAENYLHLIDYYENN